MSGPTTIYAQADVARLLRVTPAAVGNYRARHDDTPAPTHVAPGGREYWDRDGMAAWLQWSTARHSDKPISARALEVEVLRDELANAAKPDESPKKLTS